MEMLINTHVLMSNGALHHLENDGSEPKLTMGNVGQVGRGNGGRGSFMTLRTIVRRVLSLHPS